MRLYHITFNVAHREDFLELTPHRVNSYVKAECPYQALFFVRSRLNNTPWKPMAEGESWEMLDPDRLDLTRHNVEDVEDALRLDLVVLNIENHESDWAISA